MGEPKRILIVRPSALGDVCRTVPILVTLRRAFPAAAIDWVVQEEFAPAVQSHPHLGELVPFPRRRFARWWRNPAVARELAGWFAALRRRRYDVVYDCQGLGRSGLITWATRAPRRVGHRSARELGWLGYNVRHTPPAARHTVEQMMSLLAAEGVEPVYDMTLYVAAADQTWWIKQRAALGMSPTTSYVFLAPATRWLSKRWPPSCWSALVPPLLKRGFDRVIVSGAPSERDQVQQVIASTPSDRVVNLTGRASLGQSMAVIADAGLVVANDSAPLHMAVGFDRPCVGLYGPTDPDAVGPYGRPEAVVCSPHPQTRNHKINFRNRQLGDKLMRQIGIEPVLDRIDAVLNADPAGAIS